LEKDKNDNNKETPNNKDTNNIDNEINQKDFVEEKKVTNFGNTFSNSNSNLSILFFYLFKCD